MKKSSPAVLTSHGLHDGAKFVDEVFWRSYYEGWLEHHPGVWASYADDCTELRNTVKHDAALRRAYTDAIFARAGIAPFDAWASEATSYRLPCTTTRACRSPASGFSLWVYPRQLGAQWFHYHLLDGDAASNALSWRWVAGLHTKGKPIWPGLTTFVATQQSASAVTVALIPTTDSTTRTVCTGIDGRSGNNQTSYAILAWPHRTDNWRPKQVLLLHDEDMSILAPIEPDAVAMLAPQRTRSRSRCTSGLSDSASELLRVRSARVGMQH